MKKCLLTLFVMMEAGLICSNLCRAAEISERPLFALSPKREASVLWHARGLSQVRYVRSDGFASGEMGVKIRFRSKQDAGLSFPGIRFQFKNSHQDWSDYEYMAFELKNPESDVVGFCIGINQYENTPTSEGFLAGCTQIGPQETATYLAPLKKESGAGLEGRWGPYLMPRKWRDDLDIKKVKSFEIVLMEPKKPRTLFFAKFRLMKGLEFSAVVDRYGQNATTDWLGKIKSDDDMLEAHAYEDYLLNGATETLDAYGGQTVAPPLRSSGHFRVEKVEGRHVLVTPLGGRFFSIGMNSVNTRMDTKIAGRENLFQQIPFSKESKGQLITDFYVANLNKIYSNADPDPAKVSPEWKEKAVQRLLSWGFNTLGAWSDDELMLSGKIPYIFLVPVFQLPGTFRSFRAGTIDYPDFFDPSFKKKILAKGGLFDEPKMRVHDENPWCMGLFVDNEIHWTGDAPPDSQIVVRSALELDASYAVKKEFIKSLQNKYGTVKSWNKAWGSALSVRDFDEALHTKLCLPDKISETGRRDMTELLGLFAGEYYKIIHEAVKKYLPHKIYFGSRFDKRNTPEAVIRQAARYVDVLSFNSYVDTLEEKDVEIAVRLDKPFIVSEFNFNALDRGAPQGHVQVVGTQAERAASYGRFAESAVRIPQCVGIHWFKYKDQPAAGRTGSGENYNCGFVSVTDTSYQELVQAASAWNRKRK